jgi:hypothetical protein
MAVLYSRRGPAMHGVAVTAWRASDGAPMSGQKAETMASDG